MLALKTFTIDEIEEGLEFEIFKTLKLEDIEAFCTLTRDFHPLHSDETYAIKHGFDDVIAHGVLLSAYSSAIVGMHLPGEHAIALSQSFQYMKPAYPGDELRIAGRVESVDERFGRIEVSIMITNEKGVKLAKGTWTMQVRKDKI